MFVVNKLLFQIVINQSAPAAGVFFRGALFARARKKSTDRAGAVVEKE
jgi:hypothetical protein